MDATNNMKKTDEINRIAYHETKQHGDTMFAFNIYPCTIPQDFSLVPLHWQDGVEIIYIKKGTGKVHVDREVHPAAEGDVFIVLPGHIHGISTFPKERMEYENIIFDMDFLGANHIDVCSQKYLHPILDGELMLPVMLKPENELYDPFVTCLKQVDMLCDNKRKGYEMAVKGCMLSAFSLLVSNAKESGINAGHARNEQKLKYVLTKIQAEYSQEMTVDVIAGECGYSSSHFMRWFKENTGIGFHGYLIAYRLNRAAELLRSTDDAIIDIASNTGFDNLSNFNRLFKKRFLMTPSEFRKRKI